MSTLIFNNQSSAPDAAGSGKSQLYAKTDGKVYAQVESGAEVAIQTGTDQAGKLLQVAQYFAEGSTQNEDWWSGSSISTYTKMHYLSAEFDNPLQPNSKILARLDGTLGISGDSTSWAANIHFTFYNDGVDVVGGSYGFKNVNISKLYQYAAYWMQPFTGCKLFTPTDTYGNVQVYWKPTSVNHTTYFGRSGSSPYYSPTQLTIMEIAG